MSRGTPDVLSFALNRVSWCKKQQLVQSLASLQAPVSHRESLLVCMKHHDAIAARCGVSNVLWVRACPGVSRGRRGQSTLVVSSFLPQNVRSASWNRLQ